MGVITLRDYMIFGITVTIEGANQADCAAVEVALLVMKHAHDQFWRDQQVLLARAGAES